MSTEAKVQRAREMFNGLPSEVRDDLEEALTWAKRTLTDHEGSGHVFSLTLEPAGITCQFSKHSWAGEMSGSPMQTGQEAIVMAVCEYLCGC